MNDPRRSRKRLPRGSHGIARELVAQNQRERLVEAFAEVVAEQGYVRTSVSDVVRRAGVSRAAFYEQFQDRQDCMLASFWELLGRLQEEINRAADAQSDPGAKFEAALRRALEIFAADPPSGRLLTVEILAAGPDGVRVQEQGLEVLSSWVRQIRRSADAASPLDSDWNAIALAVAIIRRTLIAGEPQRLLDLAPRVGEAACRLLER